MSLAKYIFTFSDFNIKCSHCGTWLKAGKFIYRSNIFFIFIICGFVYLEKIHNWELGFFNIVLIITIFVCIPSSIITRKYGVYEEQEPDKIHNVEAANIQIKDRVFIAIFGVVAIGVGLSILYHTVKSFNFVNFSENISYLTLIDKLPLMDIILGPGLVISGFGLLRNKEWSRHFLLIFIGLLLWVLVTHLVLLGISTNRYFHFYLIGVALSLWFFNRKSIKRAFPYHKNLKLVSIVLIALITLEISFLTIIWFKCEGYKIPKLQKAVYETKDDDFYSRNYFRSTFPLEYTIALPKEFTLSNIKKDDKLGIDIFLVNPSKDSIITIKDQACFKNVMFHGIGEKMGYSSPYRFAEKFFSERYAPLFLIFRSIISFNMYQTEAAEINDFNCFIEKGMREKSLRNEIHLFKEQDIMGTVTIASAKKEKSLTQLQMNDIIASIKLPETPLKSAQEFFQEGVRRYNRQDYEKAKLSFASALCLDWDNSQYHYYLGDCIFKDENWCWAKEHVEEAISLQPDYLEAKSLLEKIKNKQTGI